MLDDDGVALFSEPGQGHADAAVSAAAVRDFGVLEQEILIGPFIRHCREAGFEHVTVKPLLQSVPGFDLTLDQWESWSRLAASTRPRRALAKLAFAAAELVGLGKRGPLFEETMAVHMVRTVRQVVEHHPVIVAAKTRRATLADQQWRASIRVQPLEPVARGRAVTMTVTATNTGAATWRARSASGIGHVTLGVQLLDAEERLVTRDYHRVALPHDVGSGAGGRPLVRVSGSAGARTLRDEARLRRRRHHLVRNRRLDTSLPHARGGLGGSVRRARS